MPTALAISPHLDDAVFSAGGTLARLTRSGWRVVVATVFTASVAGPVGFALACQLDKGLPAGIDYMALRRAEDVEACRLIGAEPVWLPFPEAPHRGYGSAAALFGSPLADDTIGETLVPALDDLIAAMRPDVLLAPRAIGGHVDHVAVVDVLAALAPATPIGWWADYPYVAREATPKDPCAVHVAGLGEHRIHLDDDLVAIKTDASAAYRSQIGFQFGGDAGLRARLAATGRTELFRARDTEFLHRRVRTAPPPA